MTPATRRWERLGAGLLALGLAVPVSGQARSEVTARDGTKLHYTDMGRGEALVLLAGGPGFSSRYLVAVARRLATQYRPILFDERGTGRSSVASYTADSINLANYLDDLESLRMALGLKQLTLVGHSWGGMLAMAYGAAHPDRVRALVLIGSGGPDLSFFGPFERNLQANWKFTEEEQRRLAYWEDPQRQAAEPRRAAMEAFKVRVHGYFFDRSKVHLFTDSAENDDFEPRVNGLMWGDLARIGYDLRPQLKSLRAPSLVVQGRQDPVAVAEQVADALPGS